MLKTIKAVLFLVLACALLSGCSSFRKQDPALNLAINIAVMKAIEAEAPEKRLERAKRIVDLADVTLNMLDDQDAVVSVVYERIMSEIKWEKLDVSDQLILRQLIAHAAQAVQERIDNNTVDADKITTVKTAVQWVRESADTYRQILESG